MKSFLLLPYEISFDYLMPLSNASTAPVFPNILHFIFLPGEEDGLP